MSLPTVNVAHLRHPLDAVSNLARAPRGRVTVQPLWQNPFIERVIRSIRRECLDHVIVWNERSLWRTLQSYLDY